MQGNIIFNPPLPSPPQVQRLYRQGDYAGAARASRQAHSWASAAVVFGATIAVIAFALKIYFSEFKHDNEYYYKY